MTEITGRTSKGGIKSWLFRSTGLARVESVSFHAEEESAHVGDAYIGHAVCHTAAAASGVLIAITNNTADKNFHITRLYIDPQTITPVDLLLVQGIIPVGLTGGTDATTTAVVQKHTSKPNQFITGGAEVKISDGSADLTYTSGTEFHEWPVTSRLSTQRNMNGTNVIGPGGTWYIAYKREGGGTATDGEKIAISVNGYVGDTVKE